MRKDHTAQSILRLVQAESGTIKLDGLDISRLSRRHLRPLRRRVQIIYQDPYESLDPRFRVRDAVEEPLKIHGIGDSSPDRGDGRRRTRAGGADATGSVRGSLPP